MMNFIKKYLKKIKMIKQNNQIILHKANGNIVRFPSIKGLKINIKGCNNTVTLFEPLPFFEKTTVNIQGCDSNFSMKKSDYWLKYSNFYLYDKSNIEIGEDFHCNGATLSCSGYQAIKIGNGCMFSNGIHIVTDDSHTILDKTTKEILNPPQDIKIEDRVWLCRNTTILKGSHIPADSVVGAQTLVNRAFCTGGGANSWYTCKNCA